MLFRSDNTPTSATLSYWNRNNDGDVLVFYKGSSYQGKIYYSGGNALYAGSSDYRLKENVKPILEDSNVEDVIKKLNPVSYNLIETKQKANGFIAQELNEVFPDAISLSKNFIPNILEEATIKDNIITFNNTNKIKLSANKDRKSTRLNSSHT